MEVVAPIVIYVGAMAGNNFEAEGLVELPRQPMGQAV